MKTETKRKIKRKADNFLRLFALYGIMPMICIAMLFIMLAVNSFGAEDIENFAEEIGNKSISAVLGANYRKEDALSGFYFLSDDLEFPIKTDKRKINADKTYYSEFIQNKLSESIHYDALPADAMPVIKASLASGAYFLNQTNYEIDIDAARNADFPISANPEQGDPLVLVLHTHGTECYLDTDNNLMDFAEEGIAGYFIPNDMAFRTNDTSKNMVHIGEVFCSELSSRGVNVLHCPIMHDENDYNASYTLAAQTIKDYLAKYPSIKYVIDMHRDAVARGNSYVKSYAEFNGKPAAQVMLVVGSNQNGKHPNWLNNLSVAALFKDQMDSMYPNLCRPMYIRTARFNQEFLPGSMLLEIGTSANTLEEAENAAIMAADSFYSMLQAKSR